MIGIAVISVKSMLVFMKISHDLRKNITIIRSYLKPDRHDRHCMDFVR